MNDETKAELMKRTREWLQSCVNAATRSGVPEEADLEAFILAHIDGEPARRAAALDEDIATARAEGVAAERARVVAWLRAADSETLVWFAAQRIEQGWHDKEGT